MNALYQMMMTTMLFIKLITKEMKMEDNLALLSTYFQKCKKEAQIRKYLLSKIHLSIEIVKNLN